MNNGKVVQRPTIFINGVEYWASEPKVKAWHDFIAFDTGAKNLPAAEFLDAMAALVSQLFDGVTADDIINGLELTKLRPLYRHCRDWIIYLVNAEMDELPKNGEPGERD